MFDDASAVTEADPDDVPLEHEQGIACLAKKTQIIVNHINNALSNFIVILFAMYSSLLFDCCEIHFLYIDKNLSNKWLNNNERKKHLNKYFFENFILFVYKITS